MSGGGGGEGGGGKEARGVRGEEGILERGGQTGWHGAAGLRRGWRAGGDGRAARGER